RRVVHEEVAAAGDRVVADQSVEIVPDRFGEFGLRIELIHDAQVGREARGESLEIAAGNAARYGLRPQSLEAIVEISGRCADRIGGHQREGENTSLPAPPAAANGVCGRWNGI